MAHHCETCGQDFNTLSKKRLHDCTGAPSEMHDMPETLTDGLPGRFLTVEEAATLDESGVQRFFPLLVIGGFVPTGKVVAGYAKTETGHFLLAFNGDKDEWYVVEKNRDAAVFDYDEQELFMYVCERNDVTPSEIEGYDSSDPDYPQLGA